MTFGVAKDLITPDVKTHMGGYGSLYGRYFVGLHDDLYVKALVMDDGKQRAVLISFDLLFHDQSWRGSGLQPDSRCRFAVIPSPGRGLGPGHFHPVGPASCRLGAGLSSVVMEGPAERSETGPYALGDADPLRQITLENFALTRPA